MNKLLSVVAICFFAASTALAFSTDGAQQQAVEASEATAEPSYRDEIRCRRIEVTGSLVRKHKVCKTNAEWERIAARENAEARMMLQRNLEGSSAREPPKACC